MQTEQEQKEQQEQKIHDNLIFFIKNGFLLDKDLLTFFSKLENKELSIAILNKVSASSKTRIITKAMISVNFHEIKPMLLQAEQESRGIFEDFFKALPKDVLVTEKKDEKNSFGFGKERFKHPLLKILSSNIIPYKKIEVNDFVAHFKNRYASLRDILKNREELVNLSSIDKIGNNRDFSIIGMVSSKRITKNKNLLLEVEDPTGRITALVNQSKLEIFEKAKGILLDDVIGLRCSGTKDILFVNNFFFADCVVSEKKRFDEEAYALFISDIHIGSCNFLENNFSKFIDWLNGIGCSEEQKEKLSKIMYLFIVGDNVDGVGVYPSQEERLVIKDIKEQYKLLASYLEKIPKHINIIMCAGQHDAVRVPEPQPPIEKEFAESLTKLENLFLVSNPSTIEIGCNSKKKGLKILMYHGASLHEWISEIEELRITNAHRTPAKAVKHILKHRHLSPTHSATTYVPDERQDPMIIKEVPDIITMGEVHRTDVDMYNNILIICNSCWQSTTPYEEKVGNFPDPCKVPMLNLKTREIKILDFS